MLKHVSSNEMFRAIAAQIKTIYKIRVVFTGLADIISPDATTNSVPGSHDALFGHVLCFDMNQLDGFARISLQLHGKERKRKN